VQTTRQVTFVGASAGDLIAAHAYIERARRAQSDLDEIALQAFMGGRPAAPAGRARGPGADPADVATARHG
jgi:hypothetical protein